MQRNAEIINVLKPESATRLNELEDLVRKRNGRLELRVHDYWMEDDIFKTIPHTLAYAWQRQNYLQACLNSNKVAMLHLEVEDEMNALHQRMGINPNIPLFIAPTVSGDPTLINHERNFPLLINILKSIGVKTLQLGGQYLVFHPLSSCLRDWDPERVAVATDFPVLLRERPEANKWAIREIEPGKQETCIPFGCAGGAAIWFMQEGFKVTLSAETSWPFKVMSPDEYDKKTQRGRYDPYSFQIFSEPVGRKLTSY